MRSANYVEMTTTSIASSGAGAVTCIAMTNMPTFSLVFGTQATIVRYAIEDIVNNKYEDGIGSVAANVLTRTKPQTTWSGTVWDGLNPTALTFTGSPTSGNIRIRITPLSATFSPSIPAIQSTVAGDAWRSYPLSSHMGNFAGNPSGSFGTLTANREYYVPYKLDQGGVLSGAQFEVGVLQASSNLKWALYNMASDGLPGPKIVDFVTTATATTGVKTDTASASWSPAGKIQLAPSWFVMGFISGHAIRIAAFGGGNYNYQNPFGRLDAYGYMAGIYVGGSYATGLPATPSLGSGTGLNVAGFGAPWFGLKVDA